MPIIICSECNREHKHHAHGMCAACVQRKRRERLPDENKLISRRHYARHRERRQASAREDYWQNPLKRLLDASNKNARGRGRAGALKRIDIESMFPSRYIDFPAAVCAYCGAIVVPGANATLDHLDCNGPHILDNLVVACASCNSSRQTQSPDAFRLRLQSDAALRTHIQQRNNQALVAFLVLHYDISHEQILTLIKPEQ